MPKLTTLSDRIVAERSADAIAKQPIRKTVNLAEVEIIDTNAIAYKGKDIKISKSAFKELMNVLKIPTAFVDRLYKGDLLGKDARRKFLNTIKNVIGSRGSGGRTIVLVVSPESREIVAVHKTARNLVSNASFVDVVGRVLNDNNLDVVDFSFDGKTGGVAVNALNSKDQFEIAGIKDENFYGGVSFTNNPKNGFVVSPYINRLVCTNGMTTRGFQEQFKLTTVDDASMQKFFADLAQLAKAGFQPAGFTERVEDSMKVMASVAEMETVKKAINRSIKDAGVEQFQLDNWVPWRAVEHAYNRINIDLNLLSSKKKANAKTNTTVWELINGLTHFATHDSGYNVEEYDRRGLQMQAGYLLTKDYDGANFVRNPFADMQK